MSKRIAATAGTLLLGSSLTFVNAGPAAAAEAWSSILTCAQNIRCSITTNTCDNTRYEVDGVVKVQYPSGGSRSWSGAVSAGEHTVYVYTVGTFFSHSAACVCQLSGLCPN